MQVAVTTPEVRPSSRRLQGLMLALIILAAALRSIAYAANTSLWLDEILLSRNILELPLRALLTEPLYLDQVAPRGFLLVEKVAVIVLGPTELALRLFPFACAVAAIFLFHRVARATLEGSGPFVAMGLFAIAIPFIKFGADVKQYSSDATIAIALTALALHVRQHRVPVRTHLLIGAFGFLVIAFSQASVLVMAGLGGAFGLDALMSRDRKAWQAFTRIVPLWAAASVVAIVVGIRSMTPATREFMQEFWRPGFLPLPLRSVVDLRWFWDQFLTLFTDVTLLRYRWPAAFALLALLGFASLLRRRRELGLLLAGPVVAVMAASAAHQYPFRGRLIFFLVPATLLAVAAGAEALRGWASRLHPVAGAAVLAAVLAVPLVEIVRHPPPYEIEHWRTIAAYLRDHRQPGDVIYVLPLQRVGMQFYGPRYGIQPDEWVAAVCERDDTRKYLQDVDRFRGAKRLWFINGGQRPYRIVRRDLNAYLRAIGVQQDALTRASLTFGSVEMQLFDLSDPVRLSRASAETFPVGDMPRDPPPGCRPWALANALTDRHLSELAGTPRP